MGKCERCGKEFKHLKSHMNRKKPCNIINIPNEQQLQHRVHPPTPH